jgi:hypothetical protein
VVCRLSIAALALALWLIPGMAAAHGDEEHEPAPSPTPTAVATPDTEPAALTPTHLELVVPDEAELGDTITVRATLLDDHGRPVLGAAVSFLRTASLGEHLPDDLLLGTATTDEHGVASVEHEIRSSGETHVSAIFAGDATHDAVDVETELMVEGDRQLYEPTAGIRVPWLNLWVLAGVIAFVWALFFRVGLRIIAITGLGVRPEPQTAEAGGVTRRQLLRRALPFGSQVGIAAFGGALVALVVRSPRTHGNLLAPPATDTYRRTPIAHLGTTTEMRPMPEPLAREVSFREEVLPIFLAYGGPHVVQPRNSPPPGGLRLDAYEHIMSRDGIVVPGEPEESELIEHLLSPGMQMPPSVPPMPDERIRLIVTWIAQGARDN